MKGERSAKSKMKFSELAWPSRILYYGNIVKGERSAKSKMKFSELAGPSRILYYENMVKGERRVNVKTQVFGVGVAEGASYIMEI